MDAFLAVLEGTAFAEALKGGRWSYAAVNAAHIAGIALLIGASVPLGVRLLGVPAVVPREAAVRLLAPFAVAGLLIAVITGLALFSVRAREYADIGFFQVKMIVVVVGALSALIAHAAYGLRLQRAPDRRLVVHATLSLVCWSVALVCGRLVAFVDP